MIPYFTWTSIQFGPLTLHVWGLFAAIGVVAGIMFATREAGRKGLDAAAFESLAFGAVVWAFVGARLGHVLFYAPAYYAAHPIEILMVWKGGLSSFGGFIGAALAFFLTIRKRKLSLLPTADALVKALPLGLGCGRIGCFLIHDHPGTLAYGAGKWFAVNYPGGARYDLGLLLGVFDWLMFGVFLLLMRKPRPAPDGAGPRKDGFYFALFMLVYGPVRFGLDFLRIVDARYFGLTPAQYGSLALFVCGLWLMRKIRNKKSPT